MKMVVRFDYNVGGSTSWADPLNCTIAEDKNGMITITPKVPRGEDLCYRVHVSQVKDITYRREHPGELMKPPTPEEIAGTDAEPTQSIKRRGKAPAAAVEG